MYLHTCHYSSFIVTPTIQRPDNHWEEKKLNIKLLNFINVIIKNICSVKFLENPTVHPSSSIAYMLLMTGTLTVCAQS